MQCKKPEVYNVFHERMNSISQSYMEPMLISNL